ncbi:MAG: hypothetical protein AB1515_01135 [Nitrospirota bacterium]
MITVGFEYADFCEATLFFPIPDHLPELVSFPVWGATLLTGKGLDNEGLRLPLPFDSTQDNVYVAGFATLTIHGVSSGALHLYPYTPTGEIATDSSGKELRLERSWGQQAAGSLQFCLEAVLNEPFGFCRIEFFAGGPSELSVPLEACILSRQYSRNPKKYCYRRENG